MPRPAIPRLAAPRSACLLVAAWAALGCGQAMAQVSGAFSDPLTPKLETNPRRPPTFQRFDARTLAQADQPASFAPPPSGAGLTGFDATNDPKRAAPPQPSAEPLAIDAAPPPPAPSPYQAPIPPLASEALAATPPGEPGTIRRAPRKRKAHPDEPTDDPYAPVGIRTGSFLFYPALELSGGYNSNPGATPDGEGARLYTVAPELRVQSDWSRHELKADLRGSYTGYSPDETPTLSRPYFNGTVDGRVDVRHDTHILLNGNVLVSTDNPGSPNLPADLSSLPVFVTYGGSGGVEKRFNRFEIRAKGNVERTSYQNSKLTDGSTVSNADRNFDQIGGTLRGSYETLPGVKPFVEIEADKRVHDTEYDAYGYARDSKGVTGRVGSTFDLRHSLTGEIAIGYARRNYDDPRLAPLEGLIGDASLIWTPGALNTVKLSASSTLGETTIPGVSGVLSRNVELELDHSFRRWLIGSLKLGLGWDIYKGATGDTTSGTETCNCVVSTADGTVVDRVDKLYSAGVGITYKVDRTVQIKGQFRQEWLRSNVSGVDYTSSTVLLGVRLQR